MDPHDNRLVGYTVDGHKRRIVLHTEDVHGQNGTPRIDAVFENVAFYQFRRATLVSIVFEVEERPLRQALEEMKDELDDGYRRCGWPDGWDHRPDMQEVRLRRLAADGLRFFEIVSSFGFEGWIVAERLVYVDPDRRVTGVSSTQ
jgi:hypothetical protein